MKHNDYPKSVQERGKMSVSYPVDYILAIGIGGLIIALLANWWENGGKFDLRLKRKEEP